MGLTVIQTYKLFYTNVQMLNQLLEIPFAAMLAQLKTFMENNENICKYAKAEHLSTIFPRFISPLAVLPFLINTNIGIMKMYNLSPSNSYLTTY